MGFTSISLDYDLVYCEGSKHGNADGLSNIPLSATVVEVPVPGETILLMDQLEALPVCVDNIADWTASDPVLQQVLWKVQQGWGDKCPVPDLQPFYIRRDELSMHNGCILWGNLVVVPPRGQPQLLKDLHTAPPKIVRMKTWHAVISGGQGWMETSRKRLNPVKYVSYRVQHPQQHPCILGSGRKSPGLRYILTMLDHLWDSYF